MLLVDAHVHIYDCFRLQTFLEAAYFNFKTHAVYLGHGDRFNGILLLAEGSNGKRFHHLSRFRRVNDKLGERAAGTWEFLRTAEAESLCARLDDKRELLVIAGRQIITAEGLEVLALATSATYRDGLP